MKLWDLAGGGSRELIGPNDRNQAVLCLSFSPDGSMLASGSVCEGLRLWDAATGTGTAAVRAAKTRGVRDVKFSLDGRGGCSRSGSAGWSSLWDLAARHKSTLLTKCSTARCSSVSADGRFRGYSGDSDGVLRRPAELGCAGEPAPRRIKTNCEKKHQV